MIFLFLPSVVLGYSHTNTDGEEKTKVLGILKLKGFLPRTQTLFPRCTVSERARYLIESSSFLSTPRIDGVNPCSISKPFCFFSPVDQGDQTQLSQRL